MQERKRNNDKHTNMLHALLGCIRERDLFQLYQTEEACLAGKGDLAAVLRGMQVLRRLHMQSQNIT